LGRTSTLKESIDTSESWSSSGQVDHCRLNEHEATEGMTFDSPASRCALGRVARAISDGEDGIHKPQDHPGMVPCLPGSIGEVADKTAAAVRVVPPPVEAFALEFMIQRESRLNVHALG